MPDYKGIDMEFEDLAWGTMKTVLDREMPEKKRRVVWPWFLGVGLMLLFITFALMVMNPEVETPIEYRQPVANEEIIASADAEEVDDNKSEIYSKAIIKKDDQEKSVQPIQQEVEHHSDYLNQNIDSNNYLKMDINSQDYLAETKSLNAEIAIHASDHKLESFNVRPDSESIKANENISLNDRGQPQLSPESIKNELTQKNKKTLDIASLSKLMVELQSNTLNHLKTKKISIVVNDEEEVIAKISKNKGLNYVVGTSAQAVIGQWKIGGRIDGQVVYKINTKIGFAAHIDYSQLRIKDQFTSLQNLSADRSVANLGGSNFLTYTQDTLNHQYTRRYNYQTIGLGLGSEVNLWPKLTIGLRVMYRINTDTETEVKWEDEVIIPEEEQLSLDDPTLNMVLNENFELKNDFGNSWAIHGDFSYQIGSNWGIHVGLEKYFDRFIDTREQDLIDVIQATGSGLSPSSINSVALRQTNPWVLSTGIQYRF